MSTPPQPAVEYVLHVGRSSSRTLPLLSSGSSINQSIKPSSTPKQSNIQLKPTKYQSSTRSSPQSANQSINQSDNQPHYHHQRSKLHAPKRYEPIIPQAPPLEIGVRLWMYNSERLDRYQSIIQKTIDPSRDRTRDSTPTNHISHSQLIHPNPATLYKKDHLRSRTNVLNWFKSGICQLFSECDDAIVVNDRHIDQLVSQTNSQHDAGRTCINWLIKNNKEQQKFNHFNEIIRMASEEIAELDNQSINQSNNQSINYLYSDVYRTANNHSRMSTVSRDNYVAARKTRPPR